MKKEKTKKIGHKKAFPKQSKKKSRSKASYNKLVKKYSLEIEKYKTKVNLIKNINKFAIPSILIVAIITVLIFYKPAFIGYFAVGNEEEHVSEINNLFAENSSYLLSLEKGELKSLRINGQLIGDGSAKVYLEAGNESYLIFDSSPLEEGGLTGITGLAVDELGETDETGDLNETISENDGKELNETTLMNETVAANESEQVGLSEPSERMSHNLSNGFPFAVNETEDIDTIPPNPITNLQVINKTCAVVLSWTNPDNLDFESVKALRKEEVYPDVDYKKAIADSLVVDVTDKVLQTTLLDNTVTSNITYYYRVYSYDNSFNHALGRGVLATVQGIGLNETAAVNESIILNETVPINETVPTNESLVLNETLENIISPPEDAEILIELEYNNEGEFDTDNDGIETKDGIIDFNVNAEFNWAINRSNLCTIWETYSINNESAVKICYGNEKCCNFVGLEPLTTNWNEIFYSYYERYGATSNNKISAQVVYVDYSVNEENPYSYVYYSDWDSLNAIFIDEEKITEFNDICMETCLLSLNETSYRLRIELENANLRLDSISYTIIPEEEKENNAPELLMDIPDLIISKNSEFSIDLSKYFFDENGDSLEYTVYEMGDISALVNESIATLIPEKGFTGIRHTFIIANDSESIAVSNVFSVNVTEVLKPRNITVENVTVFNVTEIPTQLKAEINKPVKWVKIISAENSEAINQTINISLSLPKQAFNLAVKDIKLNKLIDKNKVVIKPDKDELKEFKEGETKEKELEFEDSFEENEAKEYLIEYETAAPVAVEKEINSMRKQITISSDLHYTNVLAYTDIPIEVTQQKIRLYWIRNNTKELFTNVSYYDLNNNSLIDRIEWIVPGLSNQTFEIEIEVLNVQSHPTVGGNWTVRFNTTGIANLTITAVNRTSYSEMYDDSSLTIDDLEILELRCGDKILFNKDNLANNKNLYFILDNGLLVNLSETIGKELKIKSLFVEDYYCNSTGYHTVKVLTPGEHNQEFKFNNQTSYAHNFAIDLIKASTLYYEFNCPKCELDYDSSPVNFCPMINHVQERDDFEAELSFNITYVEQVNSASICAYERYSWNGEPAINYIEKINSSELSPAPERFNADDSWVNKTMSNSFGWECINITNFVQDSVGNNETKLYVRWWGQDMNGGGGPFVCFKGFATLDECDGNNPSGALDCRPYLNIT